MEKDHDFGTSKARRVVVIGPESTGKSTLAASLATHYETIWVPEYAREFIDRLNREYVEKDLLDIAKGQIASEVNLESKAKRILICDTNLIVLKIWSEYKYGACNPEILKLINKRTYDLYLLTSVDVPWSDDPQREHPHLRDFFYTAYKNELIARNLPYVEISGEFYERKKRAIEAIDSLLL
ncbi:MAG TPA: ATP-binding protein [Cyclobacteriaceae bacterium]|jgi:NadR type nicotinamide-nucleotide adenylyltransferase